MGRGRPVAFGGFDRDAPKRSNSATSDKTPYRGLTGG